MRYPRVIYMIEHTVTKRKYIGSTFNYEQRIKNHMYRLRRHSHTIEDMQFDFDVYGDNFKTSVIGFINNIKDNADEFMYMAIYNTTTRGQGYNYKDPHVTNKIRFSKRKEAKQCIRN